MSENVAISQKTKHIDTRVKWFVELVLDKKINIVFVKSELNDSDIFTKNLNAELFDRHSNKMVWRPMDMDMSVGKKKVVRPGLRSGRVSK